MPLKRDIVWRVGVVYIVMLILGLAILFKIAYIQVVEGSKWKEKAQQLTLKNLIIESNRGNIFAADGRLLATSVPFYDIYIDTRSTGMLPEDFSGNIDSLSYCLNKLFRDKSSLEYKEELVSARTRGERYYLIKRRVDYNQLKKLKQFPLFRLGRYKGGLIIEQDNIRIHPHMNLASRTIGRITKDEGGNIVGLEGAYDNELKGVEGVRLMQKLNSNIWIPVNDGNEVEPQDGLDIVTTIDVDIQDVAENALMKQLKRRQAHHGTAVLMEVATGEIKAIANLGRTSKGEYKETYNYAIGESTVPGSTFKLASMLAALEDGFVDLDDTIDTEEGVVYYYDTPFTDTKEGGYGKISVKEVFEYSSNVGMSKIITEHYTGSEHKFIDRLYSMNLNKELGLKIRGEGKPNIKYKGDELWSGISLPMMSIGYEIKMTPLQTLTFFNAVANGGKMVKPKFVKAFQQHGEVVQTFDTELVKGSICSKSTLRKVQLMLEGVVENGTARNLRNSNYKIAGKTGTAQIANKESGYMDKSKISYQASFAGYFPADNPKYSCIVVVNAPSKDVYTGNLVAGPVFKEIADKVYATNFSMHENQSSDILAESNIPYTKSSYKTELTSVLDYFDIEYTDIDHTSNFVSTTSTDSCVLLRKRAMNNNLIPNVVGMGLKDAMFVLENLGVNVKINGRGTVVKQSMNPGSGFSGKETIVLDMSIQDD